MLPFLKKFWWIFSLVFLLIVITPLLFIFLYNFDDVSWNKEFSKSRLFWGWQNRQTAKILSKLASNSRIYKGFLLYEARSNPEKRPQVTWRNEPIAVVDVTIPREGTDIDIYQGYTYDSANITAIPRAWDRKKGLLTVSLRGKNMVFKVDNATLIYEISAGRSKKLVGRGPKAGGNLTKGDKLQLFSVGDGEYPLVLDALIMLP